MPKTVFITGVSSGARKAAVELFGSKGWKVISCYMYVTAFLIKE